MPKSVTTPFIAEKNKQSNKPINLYTIYNYDTLGNNLYFAEYKINVVFDGITYTKFPISMDPVPENVQGQIDTLKIRVSNVSRLIQFYLENYDLRGLKVSVKQVWSNQLTDATNLLEYVFYIDKYISAEQVVEFSLSSKYDVVDVELPFGRYLRSCCRWLHLGGYKGPNCLAVSAQSTCDGTLGNCKDRNNVERFGAFPSVPSQKVFAT